MNDKDKRIKELEEQNKKLERALELFGEYYWNDCGYEDCPCGEGRYGGFEYERCVPCCDEYTKNKDGCCWVKYFKWLAEKESENE